MAATSLSRIVLTTLLLGAMWPRMVAARQCECDLDWTAPVTRMLDAPWSFVGEVEALAPGPGRYAIVSVTHEIRGMKRGEQVVVYLFSEDGMCAYPSPSIGDRFAFIGLWPFKPRHPGAPADDRKAIAISSCDPMLPLVHGLYHYDLLGDIVLLLPEQVLSELGLTAPEIAAQMGGPYIIPASE